jgi:hypothetical protein
VFKKFTVFQLVLKPVGKLLTHFVGYYHFSIGNSNVSLASGKILNIDNFWHQCNYDAAHKPQMLNVFVNFLEGLTGFSILDFLGYVSDVNLYLDDSITFQLEFTNCSEINPFTLDCDEYEDYNNTLAVWDYYDTISLVPLPNQDLAYLGPNSFNFRYHASGIVYMLNLNENSTFISNKLIKSKKYPNLTIPRETKFEYDFDEDGYVTEMRVIGYLFGDVTVVNNYKYNFTYERY